VGGRWCSCDEDAEEPKSDGRGCAVAPGMVDGSEIRPGTIEEEV
jgi:hypothetical protein